MHATDIGPDARAAIQQRVADGFNLLRRGDVREARDIADGLIAEYPTDPGVVSLACEVRLENDEAQEALELVDRALADGASPASVLPRRAHVLMALMRRADAREVAAQLAGLSDDGQASWSAGRIYSRCDDPLSAITCFEKALKAGIRDPELLYDLAFAQFFAGDFAQAERHLDDLLALVPLAGDALYLRSTLRQQSQSHNHVAELEATLKAGFEHPVDAAGCLYALAKELEDIDRPDRSFEALTHGANLKRRSLQYDAAAERDAIEAIRHAYTADVIEADEARHAGDDGAGHVFIVGLPRTGTTLVERILGRHPEAVSAGELPYFGGALATAAGRRMKNSPVATSLDASLQIDFAALGREYVRGARQAVGSGARVVIDKMPINFMYCGLIMKALPNARIVHLKREPMDACYAVYKTLFQQAYHFSYDLEELAAYYATYHRLMQHWHEVMPGTIMDIGYEDLVADTERQARRLLDWCGLDWDPGVLSVDGDERPSTTASAAQVRQPIHAGSIGKWRLHEAGLAPLRRHLQDAGIVE